MASVWSTALNEAAGYKRFIDDDTQSLNNCPTVQGPEAISGKNTSEYQHNTPSPSNHTVTTAPEVVVTTGDASTSAAAVININTGASDVDNLNLPTVASCNNLPYSRDGYQSAVLPRSHMVSNIETLHIECQGCQVPSNACGQLEGGEETRVVAGVVVEDITTSSERPLATAMDLQLPVVRYVVATDTVDINHYDRCLKSQPKVVLVPTTERSRCRG